MDGSVTGGGGLNVTSQVLNTAYSDGSAPGGGLVVIVGATASSTVSPLIETSIGDDTHPASVSVAGDVNVTSQEVDNATATSHAALGGLVTDGSTTATATLTPVVNTFIGRYSSVTSTSGNISLLSTHNCDPTGSRNGDGASASTTAAAGALVSVQSCTATATANANVQTHADSAATIDAGGDASMVSRSDNTAEATANGVAGGIVAVGGVHSAATADGTTQAYAGGVNTIQTGGSLNVLAEGTDSSNSTSYAANGGVVTVDGANASADAVPNLLAAVSSSQPVTVGGDADITAVAMGNSNANAQGYAGALVQVGTSRASASWEPTVEANVGAGTSLSAGGDINIQAMNNYNEFGVQKPGNAAVAGSATATGGGLVAKDSADADITTDSSVDAHVGAALRSRRGTT